MAFVGTCEPVRTNSLSPSVRRAKAQPLCGLSKVILSICYFRNLQTFRIGLSDMQALLATSRLVVLIGQIKY